MSTVQVPADPDVKIPAAVRAAAARADEIVNQLKASGELHDSSEVTPKSNADTTFDPPPQQHQQEPPQQQQEPPQQHQGEQHADWEHRYHSMKGRFEAQQRQVSDMSAQLSALQREVQQARMPLKSDADTRFDRLITPEEESDYGTDFLSVVGKKAKEEITPELAAMKREMDALRAQMQGVGQNLVMSAREKVYAQLDQSLPDWRELNVNPQFLSWLKLPDTYSGGIRHDLMMSAFERNDSPRLLAFFKGFLAEEAATAPAGYTGPASGANAPQLDLTGLAAPGRAKSAAAQGAPAEKPIITRAQVQAFYQDSARGKYAGREDEHKRIERMIFDASKEGRIRDR